MRKMKEESELSIQIDIITEHNLNDAEEQIKHDHGLYFMENLAYDLMLNQKKLSNVKETIKTNGEIYHISYAGNTDNQNNVTKVDSTEIKCKFCQKYFVNEDQLKAHHVLYHNEQLPYNCNVCLRAFKSQGNLWKHIKTHTDERSYTCTTCNKGFTQLVNLQRHFLVHTGIKPFACPICDKKFTQQSNLNKHTLIHTGEKPFKCDACNKGFTQRANLKKHEMLHNEVRPFKCDKCPKSYIQLTNMLKHAKNHEKTKLTACN